MSGRVLKSSGQPPVRRRPETCQGTRIPSRQTNRRERDERPNEEEETKPWGDNMILPKPKDAIRFLLHNIQGLKRGRKGREQIDTIIAEVKRLNIDVLGVTEVNNHFKILPIQEQWEERIRAFPRKHSVCATNQHSASNRSHLYGGTAQLLLGNMSYRAASSERDPSGLGRWV